MPTQSRPATDPAFAVARAEARDRWQTYVEHTTVCQQALCPRCLERRDAYRMADARMNALRPVVVS